MTEYFVLTLLLYRAFKKTFVLSFKNMLFLSALFSFIYALSDEYHQTFVQTRSGNFIDITIDAIGIFAAVFIYLEYGKKVKKSEIGERNTK